MMVNGPLLIDSILISAPKTPVCTFGTICLHPLIIDS